MMAEEAAPLVPLAEKRVDFYGDEIVAVMVDAGDGQYHIYVPLRPIVTHLGLTWASQTLRLRRDPVLSRQMRGVFITKTPGSGGTQEMLCLPLEFLPGFLFGISASRVKEAHRATIVRYQEECFRVLWEAFKPQMVGQEETALARASDDTAIQELQQIAELGRAITQMAEQQIELQRQQQAFAQRLDKAGRIVRGMQMDIADIQVRLGTVEEQIHPHAYISDEQAAHLAATVKALAELLTQHEGKNQYQGIYSELYRRFGVSGYKLIRREQYDAVLAFLEDWRAAAGKG